MEFTQLRPLCRLTGRIVHGQGRGHRVGMPTANLLPDGCPALPAPGVYATMAEVGGRRYPGVTNIGTRPTVDSDSSVTIETLLIGAEGDLYGQEMALTVYRFLRPIRRMASLEAVKEQVMRDKEAVLALFRPAEEGERGEKAGTPPLRLDKGGKT